MTATHRLVGGRMRRKDRCNQCNQPLPAGHKLRNCDPCRARMTLHSKDRAAYLATRAPRAMFERLPKALTFTWIASSKDAKLGGIPATIVTPTTCPPSCAFYGAGCYGEAGFLAGHWRRAGREGIPLISVLARVRALPPGQLWRYAIVGDLPGEGDKLHVGLLGFIVQANQDAGTSGFTFTHKPLQRQDERNAIREANRRGFTVNLSANNLGHADQLAELGIAPVAVVLPAGSPKHQRTPGGRHVIACPEQTGTGLTCASCGLCAVPTRKAVIGFYAHGPFAAAVEAVVAPNRRLTVIP